MGLSDEQKLRFLHRSFKAVDGLWFVKVEEQFGFEKALEIDRAVWQVFPKIQARELKSILGLEGGREALKECFSRMLDMEGFQYRLEQEPDSLRFVVSRCPWHDIMVKSGRAHLSGRVGQVICQTEYSTWAAEFEGLGFSFGSQGKICTGGETCALEFSGR